jgi:hypothetical protein
MFGLNLSDSSSKKAKLYSKLHLEKNGDLYHINSEQVAQKYPYTLVEVKNNLSNIQNKDFNFKNKDSNLCNVMNSAIAEYFVNLFFCYQFNIKVVDFKK